MILPMIAAILFSLYFITFSRLYLKLRLNFPPFNCALCLASWISIALYFAPQIISEVMITAFGSGILAAMFSIFIQKR